MCARVPEDALALGMFEREEFQLAALLQWPLQIPQCLRVRSFI